MPHAPVPTCRLVGSCITAQPSACTSRTRSSRSSSASSLRHRVSTSRPCAAAASSTGFGCRASSPFNTPSTDGSASGAITVCRQKPWELGKNVAEHAKLHEEEASTSQERRLPTRPRLAEASPERPVLPQAGTPAAADSCRLLHRSSLRPKAEPSSVAPSELACSPQGANGPSLPRLRAAPSFLARPRL